MKNRISKYTRTYKTYGLTLFATLFLCSANNKSEELEHFYHIRDTKIENTELDSMKFSSLSSPVLCVAKREFYPFKYDKINFGDETKGTRWNGDDICCSKKVIDSIIVNNEDVLVFNDQQNLIRFYNDRLSREVIYDKENRIISITNSYKGRMTYITFEYLDDIENNFEYNNNAQQTVIVNDSINRTSFIYGVKETGKVYLREKLYFDSKYRLSVDSSFSYSSGNLYLTNRYKYNDQNLLIEKSSNNAYGYGSTWGLEQYEYNEYGFITKKVTNSETMNLSATYKYEIVRKELEIEITQRERFGDGSGSVVIYRFDEFGTLTYDGNYLGDQLNRVIYYKDK